MSNDSDNKTNKDQQIMPGNDFLSTVLESLTHPFYVIDANDYSIKLANSAAQEAGRTGAATCYALSHSRRQPCDEANHPCVLKIVKETGKPAIAEHIHFNKKGEARTYEVHGYPIFNSEGNVAQIIEYNLDITNRKHAEESLQNALQLLETIFEHAHIMIAYMDSQFNFIKVNHSYARADEKDPSFYPGKNHFDLYPNKENEQIFRRTVSSGKPHFEYSKPFTYADFPERGTSYWDWHLVPIKDENKMVTGLILTLQDVTARKLAEEQVTASLKEKEVLLREIHHRVNNNMSTISSLLSLQSIYAKDEQSKAMFNESVNRIKIMSIIHEKLYSAKDMARFNFGIYINDMADRVFISTRPADQHIELIKDIEEITLAIDAAIPCGLILNELLSNALKHAFPEGTNGAIKVSLHINEKDEIELTVSDNGRGIPGDLDFRNTESLGLTLVTALTDQLLGTIELKKEKGTEFKLTFKSRAEPD